MCDWLTLHILLLQSKLATLVMQSLLHNQCCFFLSVSLVSADPLFLLLQSHIYPALQSDSVVVRFPVHSWTPTENLGPHWHQPVLPCQGMFDQKSHTTAAISAISRLFLFKLNLKVFCCSASHSKQFSEKTKILFSANSFDFSCAKNGVIQYFRAIGISLTRAFLYFFFVCVNSTTSLARCQLLE